MLNRERILDALETALKPLDYAQAMWQGGAASFNRVDEWSDIDLQIVADDGCVTKVVTAVEAALHTLAPIDLRYELPSPTWHGHWQAFYRLQNTSPFLLIDLVVMQASNPNRFLQPEIHGNPVVHFDKTGVVQWPPLSVETQVQAICARLDALPVLFELFQTLTEKELFRGNALEAFAFYQSYTLRPLVEALRIQHDPVRYNFHTRYIHYYLPPEVVKRLERLFFVADVRDLAVKLPEAQHYFRETIAQIDLEAVAGRLGERVG